MNAVMKWLRILWVFPICLIHVNSTSAMNSYRKAGVFFGVNDGKQTLAVQSNPLLVADDSESNDYHLALTGVYPLPGSGGIPVTGFSTAPGSVSSELYLYATPSIRDRYWSDAAVLYASFDLFDSDGIRVNSWDMPLFLRTIHTIDFSYTEGGAPFPVAIAGGIPPATSDYEFTGFDFSATPKGNLLGTNGGADSDIRFDVDTLGTQANLWVASPPYDGSTPVWDISDGLLDITITSLSDNPDDVSEAHFNGLDYLGSPDSSAQPTLSLREEGLLPKMAIEQLMTDVQALNLPKGVNNSLVAKLKAALRALRDANSAAAIKKIKMFIKEVEMQRGEKIPEADGDELIAKAWKIVEMLQN